MRGHDSTKKQTLNQVKKVGSEVLERQTLCHDTHVRMMEWCRGLWTVGYWNGEVAISLRSDVRIPEWCLGMMFGNSGTVSGNGYTKYVLPDVLKWSCLPGYVDLSKQCL